MLISAHRIGGFALLGLLIHAQAEAAEPLPHVTVVGHGEIHAKPDMAVFTVGVESQAVGAGAALHTNGMAMSRVLERLVTAGIEERDLQTSSLGLWPVYDEERRGNAPVQPIGYRGSNEIQVRLRDIDRLGQILDQTVAAGVNSLSGPTLTVADPDPLLEEARDLAIADAKAKAERYAKAAGIALGSIIAIEEMSGAAQPFARQMRTEAYAADMPVALGETTFTADVSVSYAIRADD